MTLLDHLQPRDQVAGKRLVSYLCAIGLGLTLAFLPVAPDNEISPNPVFIVLTAGSLVAIAALSVSAWFFDEASRVAWALSPFLAIATIVIVDLATTDASVAAQFFFTFPVLYAACLLPRSGAIAVIAFTLVGEAVVVFAVLPFREALVDFGYVAGALVAMGVLLLQSAERQAAMNAELERMVRTDALTGLLTRRAFDEAASAALARQEPDGTALILLDVDWFKSVNDRFGHPGGDEILTQLAQLLVRVSRRDDVVCRMGGDELAVLLPDCSADVARRRADQMVAEVRGHGFILSSGAITNISVSAGMAHSPTDADDAQALYSAADAALYDAKRAGRDRVMTQSQSA